MSVWYEVIKDLRSYLRGLPTPPARHIEGGALDAETLDLTADTNGLTGAIFLIRDKEPDESIHKGGEGVVMLFAENWVRSDDPDPITGYELLSKQEDAFKAALTTWCEQRPTAIRDVYDIIDVEIDETIGDADSRRPFLGSRTIIKVIWSKRTI